MASALQAGWGGARRSPAGFVGLYLVPFLKYPADPPGIGRDGTLWDRANLYLVMVACSVAFGAAAVMIGRRLQRRFGTWNATLLGTAAYAVAVGAVMALLPHVGELPTETPRTLTDGHGTIVFPGFPADTLAEFRLYAVAGQALLWTTIGLVFAPWAERLLSTTATSPATTVEDSAATA